MKKYGLNIGTKITLSLVFIMLAGMFMVAIAVLKMAECDIAQQKMNSAALLANNLAQAINQLSTDSELQTSKWLGDIQPFLHSAIGSSSFDYIALVNTDKVILAQAAAAGLESPAYSPVYPNETHMPHSSTKGNGNNPGKSLQTPLWKRGARGDFKDINLDWLAAEAKLQTSAMKPVYSFAGVEMFNLFERNPRLSAVVPLFRNGQKWGIVYAQSFLGDLHQDIARLYKLTFLYLVLDALLLFVLGYLLVSKSVVQPIRRLTSVVDATSDGDLGPFTAYEPQNEIGKLYHAFERMGKRLRKQRSKIEDYIASLKSANRQLKKAQEEVIRSEKLASVGRLASGVAHEIGNPLAATIGYVELLRQGAVSKEEQQDFLNRTASELQRINDIIRDLLDFSRPSPRQIEGVSVNAVIEGSLSLLAHQKAMRNIRVQTNLQPDLPLARANAQQLRQVLINILVNAIDAMPTGGDLQIRSGLKKIPGHSPHTPLWKRGAGGDFKRGVHHIPPLEKGDTGGFSDEYIVIDVEDSGTGIKAEDLPRIFDPFFTTKAPGEGTGLGLAISLVLMESFGGKITVESMVGKGTKVSVRLKVW